MIGEEKQNGKKCCDRLGNEVIIIRSLATKVVEQKHLYMSSCQETCIIPQNTNNTDKIAGFDLFVKFKTYRLVKKHNFQQFLVCDRRFISYLELAINTKREPYMKSLLEVDNTSNVDGLCQDIILLLYNILSKSSDINKPNAEYEMEIIKLMQKKEGTVLDHLIVKEFDTCYDKSIVNRCCFLCIVNIMKHFLLETILPTIIKQYRVEVLTFTRSSVYTHISTPTEEPLNDKDVNLFFGWAVMKLKKKYQRQMLTSIQTEIITTKINILDDMSASIINLVNDKEYLQMYYPTDFTIRNKGNLTLITPHYVSQLSVLLKLSSNKIQLNNYTNDTIIPDKEEVLNLIKNDSEEQEKDIIAKLVEVKKE